MNMDAVEKKRRKERQAIAAFYAEQMRRYCEACPDWRSSPTARFLANYGNW